jgi:hypothetical protein
VPVGYPINDRTVLAEVAEFNRAPKEFALRVQNSLAHVVLLRKNWLPPSRPQPPVWSCRQSACPGIWLEPPRFEAPNWPCHSFVVGDGTHQALPTSAMTSPSVQ